MIEIKDVKFENGLQYKALAEAGITTLEQCADKGTVEMLKVRGIGKNTVESLHKACVRFSIPWKKSEHQVKQIERMAAFFEKEGIEKSVAKKLAEAGFNERLW